MRAPRCSQALRVLAALALAAAGLAACSDDGEGSGAAAGSDPIGLDVLVYNIEYSGDHSTDRVIRRLDADVVGVLESYERLPEIARRTGYEYYNASLQLLSRYPILEPSGADGLHALVEVAPGQVVPFFNEHLDYVAWGPRALRHGDSTEEVIHSENEVRTSALERPIEAMGELLDQGYPVILTGDLNEPSSLDYTAETAAERKWIDKPVAWPVSEALLDLGFSDSYREIHPDPVADPGLTQASSHERIDYVYAAGPARTLDSKLVGEPGGEDVDIEQSPWTSDHRAVLSSLEVEPAAMPTLVAVDARLATVGDELTITHSIPGDDGGEVAIVAHGAEPGAALETLQAPAERGESTLGTDGWDPGPYDAVLLDGSGSEVARVGFFLRDPAADLRLGTDKRTYRRGEPITVSWVGAPGTRWDWLGVYKASASDPRTDSYLSWEYAEGHSAGTVPPRPTKRGHARPSESGQLMAPGARPLRRSLPTRRPVPVRRRGDVHGRALTCRGSGGISGRN